MLCKVWNKKQENWKDNKEELVSDKKKRQEETQKSNLDVEVHVGKKEWNEMGEESFTKMLKETKVRTRKVIQRRKWEKVRPSWSSH